MSSASSSQGTQVAKATNPRLRAACNACNTAKTKCSGERTGCNRCQSVNIECIYAESRVGKVPGVRAKKNTPGTSDMNGSLELLFPQMQSSRASEPPAVSATTPVIFDDAVLDWNADFNDPSHQSLVNAMHIFNDERTTTTFAEAQQGSSSETLSTAGGSFSNNTSVSNFTWGSGDTQVLNTDFNVNESRPQSSIGTRTLSQTQPRQYTEREINSQCVTACSQMITTLENYIVDQLRALDLILGIVKRVVDKLSPLVGLQLGPRNLKCLALFGVMMYQIIELVEAGCANFLAIEHDDFAMPNLSPSDSLVGLGASTFGLGFGAFHFNHEEQKMWRSQAVLKELLQIFELLRKIMALANAGPHGQESTSSAAQREGCYHDLEGRLKMVIEKVRRRAGTG